MAKGIDTTRLPQYVEQNRDLLLANTILGAKTLDYITPQTGVKNRAVVNILTTKVTLGDGKDCGFQETASSEFTQREIVTGMIAVGENFCNKKLVGKWTEHDVRIAAGKETLPFEQKMLEGLASATADEVERVIWQGDTEEPSDESLKRFDGFIKILTNDEGVVKVSGALSGGYMSAVKKALLAIPAKALKGECRIFCSPSFLRAYGQELVEKNLFHYEAGKDYNEFPIMGSSVILTAVDGLEGTETNEYLVGGNVENFFYGCDMEDDNETFEFWWSKDERVWKYLSEFNAGVQVAFPKEIVLTTLTR